MASRTDCRSRIARHRRLAVIFLAMCVAGVASADDFNTVTALPEHSSDAAFRVPAFDENGIDLGTWNSSLAEATFFHEDFQESSSTAPATELAAGLDVQVEQKRRKFRTRLVDYMNNRSTAFGRMTDFLLGGADSGWHFVVDPTGEDEYTLQWKARFR